MANVCPGKNKKKSKPMVAFYEPSGDKCNNCFIWLEKSTPKIQAMKMFVPSALSSAWFPRGGYLTRKPSFSVISRTNSTGENYSKQKWIFIQGWDSI